MSDYYCDISDKPIELKFKMKPSYTRLHKDLSTSIVNRYCNRNPPFLEIEDIFKKLVYDYIESFGFYNILCEWKLDFDKTTICVKSERKCNIQSFWYVRRYSVTKIDFFGKQGDIFSLICELKIFFISDLRNMTNTHYLNQPKSMIEWKLNEKLSRNPEVIKRLRNISHPLIRKYMFMFPPEDNQDLIFIISSILI